MDPGLDFDEKLEKDSLMACKKRYHILVRKPNTSRAQRCKTDAP